MAKFYCPKCNKLACKVFTHPTWTGPSYRPSPGVTVQTPEGQAPRVQCRCGQVIILLRAEQ